MAKNEREYRDKDDGTTVHMRTIAEAMMCRAKKAVASGEGSALSWEQACSHAHKEVTRRTALKQTETIATLNANPDAVSLIAASQSVAPVNASLVEAEARARFVGAGYSVSEAVNLARQKLLEVERERLANVHRVAAVIRARMNGGASYVAPVAPPPAATPAPVMVDTPLGYTRSELISLAEHGQLAAMIPKRSTTGEVSKVAERLMREAIEKKEPLSREEAFTLAHKSVHGGPR